MADNVFNEASKIAEIVSESSRLRYLLSFTYGMDLTKIEKIRVDGDNIKVDVWYEGRMYRFKAKGTTNALKPKVEDPSCLEMVMDPALAQGLYNLVDEFA